MRGSDVLLWNTSRLTELLKGQFTFRGTVSRAVYETGNSSGIPKLADPNLLFIKQSLRSEAGRLFLATKLE